MRPPEEVAFGHFWQDLTVVGGCWGRRGSVVGSRAQSQTSPPARPASEGARARSEFGIAGGPTQGYPAFFVVFPRPPLPPLPPAQPSETTPPPSGIFRRRPPTRSRSSCGAGRPGARPRDPWRPTGTCGAGSGALSPQAKGQGAGAAAPRLPLGTGARWSVGFPRTGQILRLGFPAFDLVVYTLEELFIERNSLITAGSFYSRCLSRGWMLSSLRAGILYKAGCIKQSQFSCIICSWLLRRRALPLFRALPFYKCT